MTPGSRLGRAWRPAARVALLCQLFLPLACLGLSVLAMTVPDGPVLGHLAADVRDGRYGPDYVPDGFRGRQDRFSECIAATQGVASSGVYTPWERVVLSPRLPSCDSGAALIERLDARGGPGPGPRDESLEYARYWHGYVVVMRPLVAVGGLGAARVASGVLLLLALIALVVVVARRRGLYAGAALVLPLLVSTNLVTTPLASHQAIAMAAALGSAALVLAAGDRLDRLPGLAVLAGGVFAYADFLSNPALAWVATAVAATLTASATAPPRERVLRWLAGTAGWPLGYALTWASKWLVVGLAAGFGRIGKDVVEVGATRLDGAAGGRVDLSPGVAIADSWGIWMRAPATPWVVGACLLLLATGLVVAWRSRGRHVDGSGTDPAPSCGQAAWGPVWLEPALVLGASLVVPAWCELLKNHSQIHAFFVYRSMGLAAGCVALAGVLLLRGYGRRTTRIGPGQPCQR